MKKLQILVLALSTLWLMPASASDENPLDIVIVANKNVGVNSLTIQDVRALFLKERATWQDGGKATPINAKSSDPLRTSFRKSVLQMTAEEETRYWQDQKIVRGATPPTEFKQAQRAVFALKGSIGYVYLKDHKDNVSKILLVIPAN